MSATAVKLAYAAAIAGGAILWLAVTIISGKKEAWDSSLYWAAAYPLAIVPESAVPDLAQQFVDFILSSSGQMVMTAHGFQPYQLQAKLEPQE